MRLIETSTLDVDFEIVPSRPVHLYLLSSCGEQTVQISDIRPSVLFALSVIVRFPISSRSSGLSVRYRTIQTNFPEVWLNGAKA